MVHFPYFSKYWNPAHVKDQLSAQQRRVRASKHCWLVVNIYLFFLWGFLWEERTIMQVGWYHHMIIFEWGLDWLFSCVTQETDGTVVGYNVAHLVCIATLHALGWNLKGHHIRSEHQIASNSFSFLLFQSDTSFQKYILKATYLLD